MSAAVHHGGGDARVLHVVASGPATLRVEHEGRMAAEAGFVCDLLELKPAGPAIHRDAETVWPWGDVVKPRRGREGAGVVSRGRRSLRRRLGADADVHYDAYPQLRRVLAAGDHGIVHWKDLYAARTAIGIAHDAGSRFVLDLHENYPYNMWSTARDLGADDDLYRIDRWFDYERLAVEAADSVLVTVEEMAQRLIGMHEVDPAKLEVVHNTEPATEPSLEEEPLPALDDRFEERLVALYVGSCSRHRGLDTIIRALARVREELPAISLIVVGAGPALAEWKGLTSALGVSDLVSFEGAKPLGDAAAYYRVADFGVIPHHKYGQTDNTVPHKLYQNMSKGLPSLVSSCHSLQRIITASEAGLVFEAGSPDSAAAAIARLADPQIRTELGKNAIRAVGSGPLSWDASRSALVRAYGDR